MGIDLQIPPASRVPPHVCPPFLAADKKNFYMLALCIIIITVGAYGLLPGNKFVLFDDPEYITENVNVLGGLTSSGIAWAFTNVYQLNWHPLTWISHMLDVQLYGLNPAGHHITSLLTHLANSVLLLTTLRKMTGALWKSGLVAVLFAIHPLHVESVAWASERKDLLCAFFWLLTLQAYLFYLDKPGWKRYLLLIISFVLGLMTKSMLVTLPCVLLFLDYWPLRRTSGFITRIIEKIPLFLLSACIGMVTYRAQICSGPHIFDPHTLMTNASNALQAYVSYLVKTLWPTKLAVLYPFDETMLTPWRTGSATLILLAVTLAVFVQIRRRPYLAVGWLWYLVSLVPVIGIVRIGFHSMADRYTYIPHIGLFIAIIWGLADLVGGSDLARRFTTGAAIIVVGVLAVLTFQQVRLWHDTITLMEHTIAVTKNNWFAYSNLGGAFILIGTNNRLVNISASLPFDPDTDDRRILFLKRGLEASATALRINPDYPIAQNNSQLAISVLSLYDISCLPRHAK